ncbi:MAG TPA: HAD family acid phosphatase [Woeseiaceae bacterium]|nr:HAD family acid phosphatase [Woeseiaceae bacterium]
MKRRANLRLCRFSVVAVLGLLAAACTTNSGTVASDQAMASDTLDSDAEAEEIGESVELGLQWVEHAAEYRALTRQAYGVATRALPELIADHSWSAMPEQQDAGSLPPAVILDVDETVVSNVGFQLSLKPPFANWKLDEWARNSEATPIEGAREFVEAARALGVSVFFVTNRPCEPRPGISDPCPQRQTTIDDIEEVGIPTDAAHVLLSEERGWTREKLSRRLYIAQNYRVIMLIGDDYGDFVPCTRKKVAAPCTQPGTRASRAAALEKYRDYWGQGWYILPNPMHGSWTTVE